MFNGSIFYWYFKSIRNLKNTPLVFSITGNKGCSSMFSVFKTIGPYRLSVVDEGLKLSTNPYSWNQVAHQVFLDFPAGVGFSKNLTIKPKN